ENDNMGGEDSEVTLPEDSQTDDVDEEEETEILPEDDSETGDVDEEGEAETKPEDPENDSVESEEPAEVVAQSMETDSADEEAAVADDTDEYYSYDAEIKTLTDAVESAKDGITLSYSDGILTISGSGPAIGWASNAIEEWLKEQGVQDGELTRIQFYGDCQFSGIMSGMFAADNLKDEFYNAVTKIDLTGLDTSEVTAMDGTFALYANLESLDVSKLNTGNVENMGGMFQLSANLKSLDLSSFNTGNVNEMGAMFQGCSNLESLNVSSFDTSQVTSMVGMFYECKGLTSLDLSSFRTGKVTDMQYMFYGCENLKVLDISGFDASNVTKVDNMFDGCTSLEKIKAPKTMGNVTVELPYTFYDETGKPYNELSSECEGKTLTKTFGGSGDTEGNGDGGDGDDTGDTGNTGSNSGNAGDTGNTGSDSGNAGDTGNTGNTGSDSGNAGDAGNTSSGSGNAGDTGSTGSNSESAGNNGSGSAAQVTGSNNGTEQLTSYLLPIQYTVVKGDMLIRIARKYGVSLDLVVAWNPQIKNPDLIYPGQVITVGYTVVSIKTAETPVLDDVSPTVSEEDDYYIVKRGDCLYNIALRNGVSFRSVLALNPELVKQKYIYAGQKVRLR
ncbi:MAG: BspA family leucine-rich repeat surface protein, partial [Lachnospiraceae bacterium]|nr:BspA family leucine-rich repeat surface protein [Lachnospiraceae bacterium]